MKLNGKRNEKKIITFRIKSQFCVRGGESVSARSAHTKAIKLHFNVFSLLELAVREHRTAHKKTTTIFLMLLQFVGTRQANSSNNTLQNNNNI